MTSIVRSPIEEPHPLRSHHKDHGFCDLLVRRSQAQSIFRLNQVHLASGADTAPGKEVRITKKSRNEPGSGPLIEDGRRGDLL